MKLVKAFSDFTNSSFDVVWGKSVGEVFSVMSFAREYFREQANEIKKWSKKH